MEGGEGEDIFNVSDEAKDLFLSFKVMNDATDHWRRGSSVELADSGKELGP